MANVLLGIHCVVPGCMSTLRKVNQWKARPCPKPKHKGKTQSQCMCPEPYQFFKFPTEVKLQKIWLERVKRPDLEINNLTRVCSLHFVEGKPTRRNYFPNVNLRNTTCMGEDADNEEDIEEHETKPMLIQKKSPSPPKLHQRVGEAVSIVPMEILQEEEQEEVYEGDLTISRFSYHHSRDDDDDDINNAYEAMPSNTVTITRVTTTNNNVAAGGSGNHNNTMRMDNRLSGGQHQNEKRKVAPPPPRVFQRFPNLRTVQQGPSKLRKIVHVPVKTEDYDCPYEIDMVEEDGGGGGGGDCFEVDEMRNESKQGPRIKKVKSERYITPRTSGSLHQAESRSNPTMTSSSQNSNNAKESSSPSSVVLTRNIVKPKMIPILAVAPKTQNQVIQPLAVITQTGHTQSTLPPLQQNRGSSVPQRQTIAATSAVANNVSVASSIPSATTINSTNAVFTQAAPAASTANTGGVSTNSLPLATYDPSKQQLQIANPVKYIQECHTRIADLAAENEKLKSKNKQLESDMQELQKSNNDLRKEIAQQQLTINSNKRLPQSSSIQIVPKQESSGNDVNPVGSNLGPPKSRIRYVIRRPMQ